MNRSFKQDYKQGKENEDMIFNYLKDNIKSFRGKQIEDNFSSYDIIDTKNKYFIEVKSRTYSSDFFSDWMVGRDKINMCDKLKRKQEYKNYKFMLINIFTDKIKYVIIEDLENDEYRFSKFQRKNRSDKRDVLKKYMYIDSESFEDIDNYKSRRFIKIIRK